MLHEMRRMASALSLISAIKNISMPSLERVGIASLSVAFSGLLFMGATLVGESAHAYELSSPIAEYIETPKKRADVYVEGEHAFSKNYDANTYTLGAIIPVNRRDPILLEVHQLSRNFKNGPTITDTGGLVGYIWAGKHYYVENSVAVNPHAVFLPQTNITVVPHWVTGFWGRGWDFSLGLIGSRYAVLDAFTLNPRILCDSDSFYYAASFFGTRTYHELYSTDLIAGIHLSERQRAQVDYSFGRTIEDRGIEDTFHGFGGLYQFRVWRNWYLGPTAQFYRGDLRSEDNYGLKVDVKL